MEETINEYVTKLEKYHLLISAMQRTKIGDMLESMYMGGYFIIIRWSGESLSEEMTFKSRYLNKKEPAIQRPREKAF